MVIASGLIGSLEDGLGSVLGTLLSNAFVATTGYAADLLTLSNTFGLDYVTRRVPSYVEEIRVGATFRCEMRYYHEHKFLNLDLYNYANIIIIIIIKQYKDSCYPTREK